MIILDSSVWIGYFTNAKEFQMIEEYVTSEEIITPTIVLYEVFKRCLGLLGEEQALLSTSFMKDHSTIIELTETIALCAARISTEEKLAMADAIIAATADIHRVTIMTSDADLKNRKNVKYIAKK